MTREEAQKVAIISLTADSGCNYCAAELCEKFAEIWPEHKDVWDNLAETKHFPEYKWKERITAMPDNPAQGKS